MEAAFNKYFWLIKALGITAIAGFVSSATVTWVGNSLIFASSKQDEASEKSTKKGSDEGDEDSPLKPSQKKPSSSSQENDSPTYAKQIEEMLAHNVFCPTCKPIDEQEEELLETEELLAEEGQVGKIPSTLPLRLLATMEASDPAFSQATIRDEEGGGVRIYRPKDVIRPGVLVVTVEQGFVHLQNRSQLEYLELGVDPGKVKAPPKKVEVAKETEAPKKPTNPREIPGAKDAIKCDENATSCTVERDFVEELLRDPMALSRQARVLPSVKEGETRGFKFYGIRSGSLPQLLGLKNGDLLMSVNGNSLTSLDEAMGLYQKLRSAANLSVVIERKGETLTKEISIR